MAKKMGTVVACLVAIGVGVYLALPKRQIPKIRAADYYRPWVCEACGHTFRGPSAQGMLACPQCGKKRAVWSVVYTCGKCGAEFEAYRARDYSGTDPGTDEAGEPVVPATYYKRAGGTWTTNRDDLGTITCPKCKNADPATVTEKRFAPGGGGGGGKR